MGTYSDFLRTHSGQNPRVRRLYWVYGEEDMFRVLTVARIKQLSNTHSFNITRLSVSDTPETEIWASLNQHPLDSEQKRLIIVHDAQKLKHLDRLVAWIKDNQTVRGANATAIFVSTDSDWEDEAREDIAKSSSATLVKCALPKDESDRLKRAQEIICAWGTVDWTTAGVLALRVNFDMAEAFAVMQKASLFPDYRLSPGAIEALAPRKVEDDIVWALVGLNKRKAIEAVTENPVSDVSSIIGTLSTHVEMLSRINAVLPSSKSVKEAASKARAREQYVRRLYPHARLYPRKEAVRRTMLLTRLDRSLQRGAKEGVLEALIALW